ncbi:DUF2795 domain-containing protein [Microbacterium sp. NPDC090007]|uniref:DUF2795 domain-containing protein n=1 Tax=Microbacterium sp. NPDC090007 TaxID=3364204 RepID=UPI0038216F4A
MDAFLRTMEYPCTKDDLLREAERAGLAAPTVQRLSALQDRHFHGARDVVVERPRLVTGSAPA